jgi:hypothetical protein
MNMSEENFQKLLDIWRDILAEKEEMKERAKVEKKELKLRMQEITKVEAAINDKKNVNSV